MGLLGVRAELWVKFKMADGCDGVGKLSIPSCRELDRIKSNILCQTDNVAEMGIIPGYFRELRLLAEKQDEKYDPTNRFRAAEAFVNTRQMVARLLQKLHVKIVRRLHPTPNLCNPWQCKFSHDVPLEIWDAVLNKGIGHNSIGHEVKTSSTGVFDIRKAKYVFNWQNTESPVVTKELLLKKQMIVGKETRDNVERAEVIVSRESPMVFKFNRNSEVLVVSFKYGHWNTFGIPVH